MPGKKKVLLAMSGGIDSSVAALLLLEQGFEVLGMSFRSYAYPPACQTTARPYCSNLDAIHDARSLALKLNIPHYELDLKQEFEKLVIKEFVNEYLEGRTPNPCIICNPRIKWGELLKRADQLDCEFIATGHYAQLMESGGRWYLAQASDENKDQSYVLWRLSQEQLKRTIFPLGAYTKSQIRSMATAKGFNNLAIKRESYEICFIPDNDYCRFIGEQDLVPARGIGHGTIIDTKGNTIGNHKGYPYYTVGQKITFEDKGESTLFVKHINAGQNQLMVAPRECLMDKVFYIKNFNGLKYESLSDGLKVQTKIRQKDSLTDAIVYNEGGRMRVELQDYVFAVAPGQSAVFYKDGHLIGGGFIA